MQLIVPAILEDTLEAFDRKLGTISKLPNLTRVQIDFSDGKFTNRKTVAVGDLEMLNPSYQWEAHLMVENPSEYFFDAKLAGFNTAVIHFEAVSDKSDLRRLAKEIRDLKLNPGLAIKPETAVEEVVPFIDDFNQILILGVNPGYQGQQMDPGTFEKIKKLRNSSKNVIIEVDGGVKIDNARQLYESGADFLVVGSALFDPGQDNSTPEQNFERFSSLLSALK